MITARPLVEADLAAVVGLLHAYDRRWFGAPVLSLEDVRAEWRSPSFDLGTDGEGWDAEEGLVAFGTMGVRGGIELAVADDWAGAGLEDAILERWEGEARRRGFDEVRRDLPAADSAGLDRLTARGWTLGRTGWIFGLAADAEVVAAELPAGYAVRELRDGDVEAAYAVVRDAFTPYGGPVRSLDDWRAGRLERPDVALASCRVATWQETVVGVCLVEDPWDDAGPVTGGDAEAWVPQLAVSVAHRRHGLARELLARTTLAARERGVARLALYTHSDTGARGLYERFGMVVRHTLVECALDLGA